MAQYFRLCKRVNKGDLSLTMNNQVYNVWKFSIEPFSEVASDVLCALLADVGFDSFQQTEDGVEAYILQSCDMESSQIDAIIREFPFEDTSISYSMAEMENKDWNEEWEKNGFEPICIPGLCVIHDAQHSVKPEPFDILLQPRMAFGSGTHETTSQLTELLLRRNFAGKACLDMGCGTGILAICMALSKADYVAAIDIDEFSVENTRFNASLNGTDGRIKVYHGDAAAISQAAADTPQGKFDLIVANIHRNIIVNDLHVYVQYLTPGGSLIVSGFFTDDIPTIKSAAEGQGLHLVHQQDKNNWAVLELRKD